MMKMSTRFAQYSLILLSFFFCVGENFATPPEPAQTNCEIKQSPPYLPDAVKGVRDYYRSQRYNQDVSVQVQHALQALIEELEKHKDQKNLAIVSDIDDTVLSSHEVLSSINYGFYMPHFSAEIDKAAFPAIEPMHALMTFAKAHNIAVFYVTGRTPSMQASTESNLKLQGFDYWNQVFYKPADYHEPSVAGYKSKTREQIEAQGFMILLSIGDQESDLSGGHAEKTIKLPNYMYFIP